ncbi:MAG: DoxX-like family protein [Bacteroidota bacterium]
MSYYYIFNYCIASVWIVMGLFCKTLHFAPRHQDIVARILGVEYAAFLTPLIGIGELFIAIWIIINIKSRWCAIVQITLIIVMNVIEFFLAADLLLWGKWNSIFALLFAFFIYFNEFILKPKILNAHA